MDPNPLQSITCDVSYFPLKYFIFPFLIFHISLQDLCLWLLATAGILDPAPDPNPLQSITLFPDSFPGVFARNIHRRSYSPLYKFSPRCKELTPTQSPVAAFTTQLQLVQLSQHAIPALVLYYQVHMKCISHPQIKLVQCEQCLLKCKSE